MMPLIPDTVAAQPAPASAEAPEMVDVDLVDEGETRRTLTIPLNLLPEHHGALWSVVNQLKAEVAAERGRVEAATHGRGVPVRALSRKQLGTQHHHGTGFWK